MASAAGRPAPCSSPSLPSTTALFNRRYWIVGLNPSASAFFIFCFIVICEGLAAQGLGTAIAAGAHCLLAAERMHRRVTRPPAGSVTANRLAAAPARPFTPPAVPDEKIALALAPMVTVILMLFGGFYANTQTIPPVLRWSE